jgi:predicted GH43/DUF377 family glycosyl hydrolase
MYNICEQSILRGGRIAPLVLPFKVTNGTGLTNPTIIKIREKLYVNIRHVQYSLYHSEKEQKFQTPYGSLSYLNPEDDVTLTTKNFICELNTNSLEIINYKEVDTSLLDVKPIWEFVGLEDARLVNWDNKLQLTGVRRDTTTNGVGRMELSELKNNFKEISRKRIESTDKNSYCEKNWMPILDMPYHFVKWTSPTEIVKYDCKTEKTSQVCLIEQNVSFNRDLRGGSQVVRYKDFYVALTHEVDLWNDEQGRKDAQYYHRFIVWDKDWNIVYNSDEFKFADARIEFSCGIHFEKNELLITFGFQDTTAFILTLPNAYFEELVGMRSKCEYHNPYTPKNIFTKFLLDCNNGKNNFNLGLYYYQQSQWSSSLSFFLRAAEIDSDKELIYESLLFVAKCLSNLGRRKTTELSLWNNAVRFCPTRPEAYLFLSQYYESFGKYSESQSFAKIGLEFKENHVPLNSELGYFHYYQLLFQEAICDWNLGQGKSARSKLLKLGKSTYPFNDFYKNLIQKNITSLGSSGDPFLPYDISMSDKLKYKFIGYENIEKNYSQTFQDMFVLTMLDGKKDGRYLEIGSADPYYGSNTALLEELGWTGLSLEILEEEVIKFKEHRSNEVIHCDATKYDYQSLNGDFDYLQVDCEPPATTYDILTKLPFDKIKFSVITYEHDHYTDIDSVYREKSRKFLEEKGYVMVVGNIAPDNVSAYEDWYVHPKCVNPIILEIMKQKTDKIKNAQSYMLENDTKRVLGRIDVKDYKLKI